MTFFLKTTLCLLSVSAIYGMESELVKRPKIGDSCEVGTDESKSNSSSPTKSTQRLFKYFEPRLPLTNAECGTIDLGTAVCFYKSGKKVRVSDLRDISFSSCQLSRVPLGFSQLTKLQTFSLENNNFSKIPTEVCCHSSLTNLDISHNPLEEFPTLSLENLKVLAAQAISLTKVPDILGSLQSLIKLSFSGNNLTELPSSLFKLTALEQLDLSDNQLAVIPEEISKLTALQDLRLENNLIESLPQTLGVLTNLTILWVNNNLLTTVPDSFADLQNLRTLFVKNNRLTEVPSQLAELRAIENIYLDGNQAIAALPSTWTSLYALQLVSVSGTRLAEIMSVSRLLEKKEVAIVIE